MADQITCNYIKTVGSAMGFEILSKGKKREAEFNEQAFEKAMKALKAQIKLKECIANLDNPEFEHVTWTHAEVLKLLKEHVTDYTERS